MSMHERPTQERFTITVPITASPRPGPRFDAVVEADVSFLDKLDRVMSRPAAPIALLAPDGPDAPTEIAAALSDIGRARVVSVTRRDAHH